MPVGTVKNLLYGLTLPVLGQRPAWRAPRGATKADAVARALWRKRCVGACVQRFEGGSLTECICAGHAALEPVKRPVAPDTVFRTASVAKMVTALLVFRLQTQGRLSVTEEISQLKKDIEEQISRLQERYAELELKEEGSVENGDTAVIDFEGFKDGVAFDGGKGENYPLVGLSEL